jgi:hypothetical protein
MEWKGLPDVAISVGWEDDAKNVLRFDERDTWTWTEFDLAVDEMVDYVRNVDHLVNLLVLAPLRFPPGYPLAHFQRVVLLLPSNVGKIALVGNSPFQRRLNNILLSIFPAIKKQVVFVDSIEDAYRAFAERAKVR